MGYLILAFIVLMVVWTCWVEPRWLKIRKISVKLNTSLKRPVTLLHIADSHFPLHLKTLRRFFDKLTAFDPDFVVYTGDMIENDEGVPHCVEALAKLKARVGKYAVLGNHDHYNYSAHDVLAFLFTLMGRFFCPKETNKVEKLKQALAEIGCRVLCNEAVHLDLEGEKIHLIGLDDPVTRKDDPAKAFQNVDGTGIKILLTHSVDVMRKLNNYPVDLALGGHTHGGQVIIPFYGALPLKTHSRLGRKFIVGLNRYQRALTYTTRGIGQGKFFSFRFLCRPEAVLFEIS